MLNDTRIRTTKPCKRPIKLSDSGGLYLLIAPHGSKLWRLAYRFGGKQKTLAIGAYPTSTLKAAVAGPLEILDCQGFPATSAGCDRPSGTQGWYT